MADGTPYAINDTGHFAAAQVFGLRLQQLDLFEDLVVGLFHKGSQVSLFGIAAPNGNRSWASNAAH